VQNSAIKTFKKHIEEMAQLLLVLMLSGVGSLANLKGSLAQGPVCPDKRTFCQQTEECITWERGCSMGSNCLQPGFVEKFSECVKTPGKKRHSFSVLLKLSLVKIIISDFFSSSSDHFPIEETLFLQRSICKKYRQELSKASLSSQVGLHMLS